MIVFLDKAVHNADGLTKGLPDGAIIYRISEDGGFRDIAERLADHADVESIHIISHGKPGQLQLGDHKYDARNLREKAGSALAAIGGSLAPDGDILFYGCDIAGGPNGGAFIDEIAELTGADIAASDDTTGHASMGGNWQLEAHAGAIESDVLVAMEARVTWQHILANSVLDWATRPLTNFLVGATDVVVIDGITVTTSGTQVGSRTSQIHRIDPTLALDGYFASIDSAMDATIDNGTVQNITQFSFSEPVYNLTFEVVDVDGGPALSFRDGIQFGSDTGAFPTATTGVNVTYNAGTGFGQAINGFCASGSGNVPDCLLTPTFAGPVSTVTTAHVAVGASGSDPAFQGVLIETLTFNTPPDATDNSNSTNESSTVGGNMITDDDGSGVDSDNQDATTALTVLSVDGTPVPGAGLTINLASGATLTVQQDGSYTFDPNGGYDSLGLGQSAIETFTYIVQDAEGLSNNDGSATDSVATLTITINGEADYDFAVTKVVDTANITGLPATLGYTITVTNTGDTGMTGVNPVDTLVQDGTPTSITLSGPTGDGGTIGTLDVGEVWTYTGSHVVTQAQIDNGNDLVNGVVVTTTEMGATSRNASATTTITATAAMTISKVPDVASVSNVGDVITYTITLTNTGATTISGLLVADPLLSGLSCVPGAGANPSDMAPGAVTTCTGTYTTVVADFDGNGGGDGDIDNTATVTGTGAGGSGAINENDSAAVTLNINADLTVTKTADDTTDVILGQLITYTYTVENTGNQTITNVSLSDAHNGSGPAPVPTNETLTTDVAPLLDSTDGGINGTWDTIAPGDIVTFTATYTVTQNDLDTLQ